MNIFEISQELQSVVDELEENGGELTDELEAKLTVSQSDFKAKIKSYGEVIKNIEGDIKLIDEEVARLKEFKESKKKTIDRMTSIIVWAIDMFGETTKTGGKFVDYGTGKINVRNTEKVEVNTDVTNAAVKNMFHYLTTLDYLRELNQNDAIDKAECIEALNDVNYETPVKLTEEEFDSISASLTFDVKLKDLLNSEGLDFAKKLISFVKAYKAKSNMSKTELKTILKDEKDLSHIACIVNNKTITIK